MKKNHRKDSERQENVTNPGQLQLMVFLLIYLSNGFVYKMPGKNKNAHKSTNHKFSAHRNIWMDCFTQHPHRRLSGTKTTAQCLTRYISVTFKEWATLWGYAQSVELNTYCILRDLSKERYQQNATASASQWEEQVSLPPGQDLSFPATCSKWQEASISPLSVCISYSVFSYRPPNKTCNNKVPLPKTKQAFLLTSSQIESSQKEVVKLESLMTSYEATKH